MILAVHHAHTPTALAAAFRDTFWAALAITLAILLPAYLLPRGAGHRDRQADARA